MVRSKQSTNRRRIEKLKADNELLQRQLDKVDEVLGWEGTGMGRVGSVEKLQADNEALNAELSELRVKLSHIRMDLLNI